MRKIVQIVIALFAVIQLNAQELNCTITVNADKIPGSNKQIFTTLQTSLNEFVNQKRWTNFNYKPQELINCNLTITVLEQTGTDFKGHIQIQSSRPVYNSTYETPVFNFKDDNFAFQYTEFEPLQYNANSFESNLVSVISFYVYTILGMDSDTFALNSGTAYYTRAQDVVVLSQQSGYAGWNQNDGSKTRFTLVDNLLSPTYSMFRKAMFDYHFNGLDMMSKDKKMAKQSIFESVSTLKSIYDSNDKGVLAHDFLDERLKAIKLY